MEEIIPGVFKLYIHKSIITHVYICEELYDFIEKHGPMYKKYNEGFYYFSNVAVNEDHGDIWDSYLILLDEKFRGNTVNISRYGINKSCKSRIEYRFKDIYACMILYKLTSAIFGDFLAQKMKKLFGIKFMRNSVIFAVILTMVFIAHLILLHWN